MVSAVRDKSVNIDCQLCGLEFNVLVATDDWKEWKSGERYIQDAFRYLSSGERELLISGTCDNCWKVLYAMEESENDYE